MYQKQQEREENAFKITRNSRKCIHNNREVYPENTKKGGCIRNQRKENVSKTKDKRRECIKKKHLKPKRKEENVSEKKKTLKPKKKKIMYSEL